MLFCVADSDWRAVKAEEFVRIEFMLFVSQDYYAGTYRSCTGSAG
jgi:hypothetical protein